MKKIKCICLEKGVELCEALEKETMKQLITIFLAQSKGSSSGSRWSIEILRWNFSPHLTWSVSNFWNNWLLLWLPGYHSVLVFLLPLLLPLLKFLHYLFFSPNSNIGAPYCSIFDLFFSVLLYTLNDLISALNIIYTDVFLI